MAGSRRLSRLASSVLGRVEPLLPTEPLVVGLSGGADSAVCAWAAAEAGRQVRAIHVNHGLAASVPLERAAGAVAAALGIDLAVKTVRIGPGPSPENQARIVRYRALEDSLAVDEVLCTGHTSDDQAETVLGNLLRGTGLDGLAGIPRRRGRIVRPLLDVSRSETRELAGLLGLPWLEDPANLYPGSRRNVLRRELIPMLEARFNPGLRDSLGRTARVAARDLAYLDETAAAVPVEVIGNGVRVPASLLATLPAAVAARAVRTALRAVTGGPGGSAADVDRVLAVAASGRPARLTGSLRVERRGVWLLITRGEGPTVPAAVEFPLPGLAVFGDWRLEAWIEEAPPVCFRLGADAEVFDATTVGPEALVRASGPGDRIRIHRGTKAVSEAFAEAGVAPEERPARPVVECGGVIVWIPGVRRADTGWVDGTTTRYLWVSATREEGP